MDAIRQNIESAKAKGKEYYDSMMGEQSNTSSGSTNYTDQAKDYYNKMMGQGSEYTDQAKDKANDLMDQSKNYVPESKGDH
ncbi:hypothetical protein BO94DRAFT_622112 [Aspergillus sclerotioniger CBS 115572]|uniref:Uncharacterized protein n=1 Tax=Aspergillus sclerotioniger CBS 115572 TaxID=1450535 RepID=A0A317X581_9EURO|nr:hypothetical protein BO94DRAFT_622112 [Aspergillus sclerotioniger CBS 115572]PWY93756.1 hypothetical protein BO94DRAFT_622112 [Aspergillus sclerotioniger CBS 115572]